MKALTTILKSGKIKIIDIPPPQLSSGSLLVQNYYSLISAGTESATIKDSKKGYIGKARSRPDQVKKVIDSFKNQGPTSTYRNVMKKLDAYSPMGYSSAGKIIGIGDDVEGFSLGDYVACSGVGYANHAEVVSVPKNLCIKLPLLISKMLAITSWWHSHTVYSPSRYEIRRNLCRYRIRISWAINLSTFEQIINHWNYINEFAVNF